MTTIPRITPIYDMIRTYLLISLLAKKQVELRFNAYLKPKIRNNGIQLIFIQKPII